MFSFDLNKFLLIPDMFLLNTDMFLLNTDMFSSDFVKFLFDIVKFLFDIDIFSSDLIKYSIGPKMLLFDLIEYLPNHCFLLTSVHTLKNVYNFYYRCVYFLIGNILSCMFNS